MPYLLVWKSLQSFVSLCVIFIVLFTTYNSHFFGKRHIIFNAKTRYFNASVSNYSLLRTNNEKRWLEIERKYHLSELNMLSMLSPSYIENGRTVIYKCELFCGGLGDRLRGIISSYLLALVSDRYFFIDMKYPCPITNFFQPNYHNWILRPNQTFSSNSTRKIKAVDENLFILDEIRNTLFLKNWSFYDAIEIYTNLDFVTPVFMNLWLRENKFIKTFLKIMTPEEANINTLFPLFFEVLFKPSIPVVQLIDPFLIMANQLKKSFLCLHIRAGRNPSNPNDDVIDGRNTITNDMILFIKNSTPLQSDDLLIMAMSDSATAVRQVLQYFPNRSFTIPGPILHIDRPAEHIDRCEGFLKVATDFYMLGECHTNLLTNSRFSAFANRRRSNPYQNLFKYNSEKTIMEICDNVYSFSVWEPLQSVNIPIYCPVTYRESTKS